MKKSLFLILFTAIISGAIGVCYSRMIDASKDYRPGFVSIEKVDFERTHIDIAIFNNSGSNIYIDSIYFVGTIYPLNKIFDLPGSYSFPDTSYSVIFPRSMPSKLFAIRGDGVELPAETSKRVRVKVLNHFVGEQFCVVSPVLVMDDGSLIHYPDSCLGYLGGGVAEGIVNSDYKTRVTSLKLGGIRKANYDIVEKLLSGRMRISFFTYNMLEKGFPSTLHDTLINAEYNDSFRITETPDRRRAQEKSIKVDYRQLDSLAYFLQVAQKVIIEDVGTFSVNHRAGRVGRNPQTGKTINIPPKNLVKFKAALDLNEAVNKGF